MRLRLPTLTPQPQLKSNQLTVCKVLCLVSVLSRLGFAKVSSRLGLTAPKSRLVSSRLGLEAPCLDSTSDHNTANIVI